MSAESFRKTFDIKEPFFKMDVFDERITNRVLKIVNTLVYSDSEFKRKFETAFVDVIATSFAYDYQEQIKIIRRSINSREDTIKSLEIFDRVFPSVISYSPKRQSYTQTRRMNDIYISNLRKQLIDDINTVLIEENFGYVYDQDKLSWIPRFNEHEVESLNNTFENLNGIKDLSKIFQKAIKGLSPLKANEHRQYEDVVSNVILTLEGLCKCMTNNPNATLGDALKILREKGVDKSLTEHWSRFYGWSSGEGNIRHWNAFDNNKQITLEEAKYFILACSAFINYLVSKCSELDINLDNVTL